MGWTSLLLLVLVALRMWQEQWRRQQLYNQ
jgi:hypothetical protein